MLLPLLAFAQQTIDFTHDAAGRLVGADYGSGQVITYQYDKRGNILQNVSHGLKLNPTADVSVVKSDSPDPVMAGSNIAYTLIVSNAGPDPATGVTVLDTLPGVIAVLEQSFTQGDTDFSANPFTWNVGIIESGKVATLEVVIKPILAGAVTNRAVCSSTPTDPNLNNNTSIVNTVVNMSTDTDGDGMPDWWEDENGFDKSVEDESEDEDGDGMTNLEEYLADTDPNDEDDFFVVDDITSQSPVQVDFPTSPIRKYRVEYAPAPANSAAWSNLQFNIPGNGNVQSVTDTNPAPQRTYRVGAELP